MIGFLLQWPTLATLAMFPVLVFVYRRLAIGEENEVRERFSAEWDGPLSRPRPSWPLGWTPRSAS